MVIQYTYFLQSAITKLDQQVCEAEKKLNACKHQRSTREKKLAALETEYNQLVKDAEEVSSTDAGESAEAQVWMFTIWWHTCTFTGCCFLAL